MSLAGSHTSHIRIHVDMEGAETTRSDLSGLLDQISDVTSLVSAADYTMMSWKRAIEDLNIVNFARMIISTINLLNRIISVTEAATAAQWAYNAALAARPAGGAGIPGLGPGVGGAITGLGMTGGLALGIATALLGLGVGFYWSAKHEPGYWEHVPLTFQPMSEYELGRTLDARGEEERERLRGTEP